MKRTVQSKQRRPGSRRIPGTRPLPGFILGVANEKGGVGKTTTVAGLGAALAERGRRGLLVDHDPRADLTINLGVRLGSDDRSVYHLLAGEPVRPSPVHPIQGHPTLFVLPAERDLAAVETLLIQDPPRARVQRLAAVLRPLRREYEWVLCDCPPGLSSVVLALLQCVDGALIPQECSFTALHGLRALDETLQDLTRLGAATPRLVGIVLTMVRRTRHAERVAERVRARYGKLVCDATIPLTVRLQEAPEYGVPITEYDPRGPGAEAYRALAQEVTKRCAAAR